MSEPLAFLNDRLVPQSHAHLTLHDAGFVMGATVTDLCRTFERKLYRWQDHLDRFIASCLATRIAPLLGEGQITARAEQLVRKNGDLLPRGQELVLVMFATPGPIGYYLGEQGGAGEGRVTFGMHTFPLSLERFRRSIRDGAALVVPGVRQIPSDCIDPTIKMRSRLHWWLADCEAREVEPGATALLQDIEGHITETAVANVLLVKNGTLLSPPRDRILNGISRQVVIELCVKLAIPFEEKPLTIHDVLTADEVMLTSTPYCLVGVSRCQGKSIPWPGPVYDRLVKAWCKEVGADIHGDA